MEDKEIYRPDRQTNRLTDQTDSQTYAMCTLMLLTRLGWARSLEPSPEPCWPVFTLCSRKVSQSVPGEWGFTSYDWSTDRNHGIPTDIAVSVLFRTFLFVSIPFLTAKGEKAASMKARLAHGIVFCCSSQLYLPVSPLSSNFWTHSQTRQTDSNQTDSDQTNL